MKKITFIILLLIVCSLTACSSHSDTRNEIQAMAENIEEAIGEEWEKQRVTEVTDYILTNAQGDTLVFYFCETTYYTADPALVTGLDTAALTAVFSPEDLILYKEWVIKRHPAAIYQGPERSYLCWTSSPEATGIMEFSTGAITDEEAYKIVESVYAVPALEHS